MISKYSEKTSITPRYVVEPIVCAAEYPVQRRQGLQESAAALISGLLVWALFFTY
jgi:hypothetical protein